MLYLGIDVAKHKHDACILNHQGNVVVPYFSFANNREGFDKLLQNVDFAKKTCEDPEIKAGLESTGHYGWNVLHLLHSKGIPCCELNPLSVKLFRQSLSLRKTKTDKIDAFCIAQVVRSRASSPVSEFYQIQELKALTRQRFRLVQGRSKAKVHLQRLVDILFPELPKACWSISQKSILALLKERPGAVQIASTRIDRLENLLKSNSHGRYGRAKATEIQSLAKNSIALKSPALSFELQLTIESIQFHQQQIEQVDVVLKQMVEKLHSPLLTIPGIGFRLAAVILAEIGDIERFASPDKLLAFAGLDPSTFQSGKFTADYTPISKRGSTYLRWALMQAARLCSIYCPDIRHHMQRKLAQGKHYYVALGHTAKKIVRLIFCLLKRNEPYQTQTA